MACSAGSTYCLRAVFDAEECGREPLWSVWTDLASDTNDEVRKVATDAVKVYLRIKPGAFSLFGGWGGSENPNLRRTMAEICGELLDSTSGEIWEAVLKLSRDGNRAVRSDLFYNLSKYIARGGKHRSAYAIPEAFALLEWELLECTSEIRRELASRLCVYRGLEDAVRAWANSDEENLRDFATMMVSFNPVYKSAESKVISES